MHFDHCRQCGTLDFYGCAKARGLFRILRDYDGMVRHGQA